MKLRERIMRWLRIRFGEDWDCYVFACGGAAMAGEKCEPTIHGFLAELIANYCACLICKWRGHHWDVDSHAGPDSGGEDFTCLRCGESHSVTYY